MTIQGKICKRNSGQKRGEILPLDMFHVCTDNEDGKCDTLTCSNEDMETLVKTFSMLSKWYKQINQITPLKNFSNQEKHLN